MQPFPIAPYKNGLITTLSPWLIPPDGFQEIKNADVRSGRIEKRLGYRLIGYNAHHPTTFVSTGDDIDTMTTATPIVVKTVAAHNFTPGDVVYIVGGDMTEVVGKRFTITVIDADEFSLDDSVGTSTYTTGAKVFLSPSDRVMGLTTFVSSSNEEIMIGWDTKRAWIYDTTLNGFIPLDNHITTPSDYMDGGEYDYISYVQWNNYIAGNKLYFVNGLIQDTAGNNENGILTIDPTLAPGAASVVRINPQVLSTEYLYGAKGVCVFKNRLLFFAPFQGTSGGAKPQYPNRVTWCRVQDPSTSGDQWRQDIRGNGGFADAGTQDQYVSHQVLQDVVIVYFTNSIYALRYQPDPIEPFRWHKLNSFVSNTGLQAVTGYDQYAIHIGNKGIYATDGSKSERIDEKIEDFIADNVNGEELRKVYGHRDYINQRSLFLYADEGNDENNSVLVRDDESGAYTTYSMALNCLGDGANPYNTELTMAAFPESAEENPYKLPVYATEAENLRWSDLILNINEEALVGGTITGEVMQLNFDNDDNGRNVVMDLQTGIQNPFRDQGAEAHLGYIDFYVESDPITDLRVLLYKDSERDPYLDTTINLLPNLSEVALIQNVAIKSPATDGVTVTASQHGLINGQLIYIYKVKGMISLYDGPFTVTNITENTFDLEVDATNYDVYTSGGIVTLKQYVQQSIYKRVFVGCTGNGHMVRLGVAGTEGSFVLHSMIPYYKPVRGRLAS